VLERNFYLKASAVYRLTSVTSWKKLSLDDNAATTRIGALAAILPAIIFGYRNLIYALSIPP